MTSYADLMARGLPGRTFDCLKRIGREGDRLKIGVYLVGGAVRDLLLGMRNIDLDLVVEGDGIEFACWLAERMEGRIKRYDRFGTALLVLRPGIKLDLASARRECYQRPGALPQVNKGDLKADLYRRDFTINSLALCLNSDRFGKLFDPYGGREDLEEGVIRVLHKLSFSDDPTRIIRAVRFEQRYGFSLEGETESLLKEAVGAGMLDRISGQRIGDEFILILKEREPIKAIKRLDEFGILAFLNPEIRIDAQLFGEIEPNLSRFDSLKIERWMVYLLALVWGLELEPALQFAQRLYLPKRASLLIGDVWKSQERIDHLLSLSSPLPSQIYRALEVLGPEALAFLLAQRDSGRFEGFVRVMVEKLSKVRLAISGDDLKRMGIPPGPIYRRILDKVFEAKLDGEVRTEEEELKMVHRTWRENET